MDRNDPYLLNLGDYQAHVFRAAERKDGELIFNGSVLHAQIIVEALFRTAKTVVKIFSDGLNQGVYGHSSTIAAVKRFLATGDERKVVIVHEQPKLDGDQQNIFANEFANDPRVTIVPLPSTLRSEIDFHLCVADGQSYRFEEDKLGRAAVASFGGDRGTAAHLDGLFDRILAFSVSEMPA